MRLGQWWANAKRLVKDAVEKEIEAAVKSSADESKAADGIRAEELPEAPPELEYEEDEEEEDGDDVIAVAAKYEGGEEVMESIEGDDDIEMTG